ncbi:hypothetical protein J437_LFUL007320 [Ladona fulva]|uniref:WD repeat-containing protein 74 n=1 Tax=Ladona fulva TaxID=123851 RepID=A0A8K0KAK8_LADFU|nr:hypothetical protein J437_LFUL007320 [Ladona fulva]
MAYKHDFNVFVGAQTGVFKGVKLNENAVIEKNLSGLKLNPVEDEVTAIAWGDEEEKEILLGLVNQTVKVFNSDLQDFTSVIDVKCGTGPLRGVCKYGSSVLTAVDSGEVKLWSNDSLDGTELAIKTGSKIDRMRHNPFNKDVIAVGGVEADLSLWNLEAEDKCIFKAKNVPHNYLELRVPIWVSDIAFMPDGQKIATCSRHGHLRLYDPKAQRRPVLNMQIPEQALTAISPCSREHHVIVGSGTGLMMLVDMRGKGLELNRYKGFAGGVRDIVCHPSEPYILSVSLDRFLRLHHLETKTLLHKVRTISQSRNNS